MYGVCFVAVSGVFLWGLFLVAWLCYLGACFLMCCSWLCEGVCYFDGFEGRHFWGFCWVLIFFVCVGACGLWGFRWSLFSCEVLKIILIALFC